MADIAIRVENLSKLYKIGKAQQRHDTLRDALVDGFLPRITQIARMGRKEKTRANPFNPWQEKDDTIWALCDVSFEACPEQNRRVKRGEVVGIIGPVRFWIGECGFWIASRRTIGNPKSAGGGHRLPPGVDRASE